ncbi:MAG: NAD(P)-dependent oxidoreductase [Flavobacteriaceae bacterium]|nr:NAD(P)-dependent oxidoreductase [Flavobacteriaceae bacterium]
MIIAITGSSGFIGRRLVSKLEKSGHKIIKLDVNEGIDILNWDRLLKISHFDVLVHLAAKSFVPQSYEMPRDFYNLNVNGVINGLELCRIHKAKFIFTSSYVYGKPEYLPIDENHSLNGFNPYAETKIIGEKICKDYHKYFNVRSIILRPFNIYGLGQNENFLIPLILKQAKTGKVKLLDPRPKRDFIFINDVVEAFMMAIENENVEFDNFNIGSGKSFSVDNVVGIINKLYNNSLDIEYDKVARQNEVLDTVADISKIKSQLNWEPIIGLEEGLKQMIQ